jgi:hypothetical protein
VNASQRCGHRCSQQRTAHTIGAVNTIAKPGHIAGICNNNIAIVGIAIVDIANTDAVITDSFFVGSVSNVLAFSNISNIANLQRPTSTNLLWPRIWIGLQMLQSTNVRRIRMRWKLQSTKIRSNRTAGPVHSAMLSA